MRREQILDQSMLANRVTSTILTAFASIALLLAAVGIYGVVSYTAVQRTYEMGIRAALGASAGHLRRLIFQGGMRLTLIGLWIGFVGTDVATRVMSSMLYGVGNDDPLTIDRCGRRALRRRRIGVFLTSRRITQADPDGNSETSIGEGWPRRNAGPTTTSGLRTGDPTAPRSSLAESEFAGGALRKAVILPGVRRSLNLRRGLPMGSDKSKSFNPLAAHAEFA